MRKTKVGLAFILITVLLTLGFYRNQWKAAGKKWFYDWKNNSDVMLVARLVWSRQAGPLADAALLGLGDGEWPMTEELGAHQYETYSNNGKFNLYWTYNSVIGAQGVIFSAIDRLTNLHPDINLRLFRGISAVLSAIAVALIVVWFWNELGYLPALLVLAFCLSSEWLTLYGASVYWQLWAFYVPFIGVSMYLQMSRNMDSKTSFQLARIGFLTVLTKTLFNGFEFITPVLGMMFVPMVFYALARKWNIMSFVVASLKLGVGAAAGAMAGLAILSWQISMVAGGWRQAFQYIAITFGKRAVGDPGQYSGAIAESLKADPWTVILRYVFDGRAINLANWVGPDFAWLRDGLEIQYYQLFILFLVFSVVFIIFSRVGDVTPLRHKTMSLIFAAWFSFLPPLTWLILFKAHAYIHANLDYIIWQMPFTLMGFALCGMVIRYLVSIRKTT